LKELIIVYGAKYLSDNMQNENFKISIAFFSLQENPALLVPWMVYVIVFLVANTILSIVQAAQYFAMKDSANGAGNIIGAVIYLCK
jgi:hypothetical protein